MQNAWFCAALYAERGVLHQLSLVASFAQCETLVQNLAFCRHLIVFDVNSPAWFGHDLAT